MNNAKVIKEGLKSAGYTVSGGVNAPYIWLKTPDKMTSWEFFDYLLENANVVIENNKQLVMEQQARIVKLKEIVSDVVNKI